MFVFYLYCHICSVSKRCIAREVLGFVRLSTKYTVLHFTTAVFPLLSFVLTIVLLPSSIPSTKTINAAKSVNARLK